MPRLWCTLLVFGLLGASSLEATSFEPVTFNDLVAQADMIFVGQVVDVRVLPLQTRERTIPMTRVTFSVSDPIAGTTSSEEVLDFVGGELNGVGLAISGMPTFTVGERRVVFARRSQSINPIVGFTQGLLQVTRDSAGVDRVLMLNGQPLSGIENIGAAATGAAVTGTATRVPMRLSDFRALIARARTEAGRP